MVLSTFMCIFAQECRKIFMEKKVYKNRIRVVLAEKMITNTYLAEQLGVSKMTISRWCANTTQPSAPQLMEISQVLQCELRDLYETVE